MIDELFPRALKEKLLSLARALVDQEAARVLIEPQARATGFWFGGGNVVRLDGAFWIVGRYRNHGDSRTGLEAGTRGLELAIFRAERFEGPYEKVRSFAKADLSGCGEVVSIEGSCLLVGAAGVELLVSTEKARPYPRPYEAHQKPGAGVWSIDSIRAGSVAALDASSLRPALVSQRPHVLHVKDPVGFELPGGRTAMIYCTHPYTWASSNSSLAVRDEDTGEFLVVADNILPRGNCWDVAATRITDRLVLPRVGLLAERPGMALYFYDGAECLREHEPSVRGVQRPRGWSCEEIGGVAVGLCGGLPAPRRLTVAEPLLVSPHGTGCSRYVSTLVTDDAVYATWQQSRDDLSQPLVGHRLELDAVERIVR